MKFTSEMEQYLLDCQDELKQLVRDLCAIPAPSHHEERRAAFCKEWFEKAGARGVYIDEALNVVWPLGDTGSNPLAVAVPADPYPFFFDASTSVVTRGKLEMYRKAEKELPDGWALNKYGKPSTDADDVLKNIASKAGGGIMPLGGNTEKLGSHKGYGYGMLVELLSSIASMGITSNHTHQNGKGGTCHGFIALDPAIFGDPDALKEHFSTFLQELRDAPKAEGAERIYTHGEKEALAVDRVKENGVPVDVKTVIEMKQMADRLGMDFASYFGDLDLDTSSFSSIYS